jgi:hypothetical protein
MMRLKPVAERTSVTVHFFVVGQFLGLWVERWRSDACSNDGKIGCLDSLVGIEGLFKTDQVRIVSSLVRFVSRGLQFNAR